MHRIYSTSENFDKIEIYNYNNLINFNASFNCFKFFCTLIVVTRFFSKTPKIWLKKNAGEVKYI